MFLQGIKIFYCLILLFILSSTTILGKNWNMATPYGGKYFHTKNIRDFVKEIEKATAGKLKIKVHSGASLYKSPEIFNAVRSRQVEMGELLMANMGNVDPIFKVDNIPFLATGYQDSKRLWEASKTVIEKVLEKRGVKLLYSVPWPGQNFYSKGPIKNIKYFKGTRLRAYNAITTRMAVLLGANPTTIQVPEIPQAFSTNMISSMITSSSTGVSSQSWDFVKYYTEVNAWLPKNMVFINRRVWRKLNKSHQKKILELAKKIEEKGWKDSEQANLKNQQILKKNGMILTKPNVKLKSDLEKVGQIMVKEWLKETGKKGQDILNKYNS